MDEQTLLQAARVIVRRNLTDQVLGASVQWRPEIAELVLHYYCDAEYSEAEVEECELAMTELIAAFPEVLLIQTHCRPIASPVLEVGEIWVFQR